LGTELKTVKLVADADADTHFARRDSSSWSSFSDVAETVEMMHLPPEICDRSFTMNRQYFLDFILKDNDGRLVFMNFLKQRHCAENLMFWVDVVRTLASCNVSHGL
jgi:hypothetical protein